MPSPRCAAFYPQSCYPPSSPDTAHGILNQPTRDARPAQEPRDHLLRRHLAAERPQTKEHPPHLRRTRPRRRQRRPFRRFGRPGVEKELEHFRGGLLKLDHAFVPLAPPVNAEIQAWTVLTSPK